MPINNHCNDKLKALIEEFGEDAVKDAVNGLGLLKSDINVNKGLICHTGVGLGPYPHNHSLYNNADLKGAHASFRMARDMGFGIDDSEDKLGNFYGHHVRAESAFIKPSEKSEEFTFNFFERLFMNSKLKNYLLLEKEKMEKYKELEPEEYIGLWDTHVEEESEWYNKPFNIFRKRKGLPAIDLVIGDVYFISLGKGDDTRIVKMRLQKIKNEDHTFPELYFSLEDCRTLKHNANHINIGIFKIINKWVKDGEN